jgi:acyl-CoA synthetase (AMP-forming)/AMP-acid ligase II
MSISGRFSSSGRTGLSLTIRVGLSLIYYSSEGSKHPYRYYDCACPFPKTKANSRPVATGIYQDADSTRHYTYADVKTAALDFGHGLKALWDWQRGDVLALFSPNCIDTPAISWGTSWAGGVVSPANPAYTVDELAFQLKDSEAKAVATQLSSLTVARAAAKKVGIQEDRIFLIGDQRDPESRVKHFTSVRNIPRATIYRKTRVNPEKDVAFLVYSSGTTGLPKGVMLSHRNIIANVLQLSAGDAGNLSWHGGADGKGDKILAFLPFFHIYGKTRQS